ncbi:unnamed protein product [Linum tenue]|uniref:TIR domain-containing protein n=1 Tax=Linum tenue TaxID=586396 RepID=A0AAV0JYL8_9ROSI|nr:unnamed protein product [Linum tenue]
MDIREDICNSKPRLLPPVATTTLRSVSSSSSTFFSANQSPFFSPRSPATTCQVSESTRSDAHCDSINNLSGDPPSSTSGLQDPESLTNIRDTLSQLSRDPGGIAAADFQNFDRITSSTTGISNSSPSGNNSYSQLREKHRSKHGRGYRTAYAATPVSVSLCSNRLRSCDVFIGFHGRKPSLLRFTNWLRTELEAQGVSCFVSDRARCRNSRKSGLAEKAMDVSSFGIVVLTRKCFRNPYTIEELRFFADKRNLVPVFFDLRPGDCLVRDIVEKSGDLWEKHGGELWEHYGGVEKEWKEAVNSLSRVDEWKLEAQEGNWRDCIQRAVTLLGMQLGRRSVVDRVTKWREKADKEEFPFPRSDNFVGRKRELSELEFMLFGDVSGDTERDYFELKARHRRKKSMNLGWKLESVSGDNNKFKEPILWKESEKEIEIRPKQNPRYYARRRRSSRKPLYGKGIACVSGEPGIGKTELLLEFAYRYHQRYKMVLWIGGESRYIRQNYLNLWSFLEIDVGLDHNSEKTKIRSFEEQEEEAILRIKKQLTRNIPFLLIIDNLESEKDWWDQKPIMDLLPLFGGETHIIISTRLPRVMNLEPMKLSYLSGVEAMALMQGTTTTIKEYSIPEVDALRAMEEKVGRLTLGLSIIGSILSELPINPSRLLDTINRMPLRDIPWSSSSRESNPLRRNTFLLQLFEVCFSIFDHVDGPRSLANRMVQASGWFAPAPIPTPLLALAASKIPEKDRRKKAWRKLLSSMSCGLSSPYTKRSESEASSLLLRFNIARASTKPNSIHVNDLIKLYARRKVITSTTTTTSPETAQAMVRAVLNRGSIFHHSEHIWAACFLTLGFGNEQKGVVDLQVSELLYAVKEVILPLAIRTFITLSRCKAGVELLRLCTDALEEADQAFVTPVEKWLEKSLCWRPIQTGAQLNPYLWQELALTRATVLETRAKLMLRGGVFDVGDDLIKKAIFIRASICGENHPDTVAARETLSKLGRLIAKVQTTAGGNNNNAASSPP